MIVIRRRTNGENDVVGHTGSEVTGIGNSVTADADADADAAPGPSVGEAA
jgi:hypothetical protein